MKKLTLLILAILLSGCIHIHINEDVPVEPVPVDEPTGEPEPAAVTEYTYTLDNGWVVEDCELKNAFETYKLQGDKLKLSLKGTEQEPPYCQGPCIVYDEVTVNDKDLKQFSGMELKINSGYGRLTLYNLNDELYLLNFNNAAQFNADQGVVVDSDGKVISEYSGASLSMNEYYQNQFALDYYDPDNPSASTFEIYTAKGRELSVEVQ